MRIFELSKKLPIEEKYSLTDQILRSSRSVCANLAEAWIKRRYEAAFIAKLNDAEAEAVETQTWLKFAVKCNYLDIQTGRERKLQITNQPFLLLLIIGKKLLVITTNVTVATEDKLRVKKIKHFRN